MFHHFCPSNGIRMNDNDTAQNSLVSNADRCRRLIYTISKPVILCHKSIVVSRRNQKCPAIDSPKLSSQSINDILTIEIPKPNSEQTLLDAIHRPMNAFSWLSSFVCYEFGHNLNIFDLCVHT